MQLWFVRCIAMYCGAADERGSFPQPSLGVSSLDLGRSETRTAPFSFALWAGSRRVRLACQKLRRFGSPAGLETAHPAPHTIWREIGASPVSQPSFGRFLPRLGPFGHPDGLFFCREQLPGCYSAAARGAMIGGSSAKIRAIICVRSRRSRLKLAVRVSFSSLRYSPRLISICRA